MAPINTKGSERQHHRSEDAWAEDASDHSDNSDALPHLASLSMQPHTRPMTEAAVADVRHPLSEDDEVEHRKAARVCGYPLVLLSLSLSVLRHS